MKNVIVVFLILSLLSLMGVSQFKDEDFENSFGLSAWAFITIIVVLSTLSVLFYCDVILQPFEVCINNCNCNCCR